MAITVEEIHDLAHWARSKACNGWRTDGICLDKVTGEPLVDAHDGCIQAQRAHDLLGAIQRYDSADVVGWLVSDSAVDPDLW
jgi:hypothetical protein